MTRKSDIIKTMNIRIFNFIFFIGIFIISCGVKQESYIQNTDGKFYYEMGISSLNTGNNAQAISYLLESIKTYKQPEVYNALALAYQFSGEYKKSEDIFKEGLSRFPDNPELLTNIGVLYAVTNRENQAITFLEKALSSPAYANKEKAYYNLGIIYRNLGKQELFLENINKSLMYNSNFLNSYVALGDYYYDKFVKENDKTFLKQSLLNYLKVLNLGLNSPEIYYKIGKIYYIMKEKELAKYYLEKGLKSAEDKDPLKNDIKKMLIDIVEGKDFENIKSSDSNQETESRKIFQFIK